MKVIIDEIEDTKKNKNIINPPHKGGFFYFYNFYLKKYNTIFIGYGK